MKSLLNRILIALTLTCLFACGGGTTSNNSGDTGTTGTTGTTNNNSNANNNAQTDGTVTSKLETANGIQYKIYLQAEANATNRKGLILLGSGNDESDPTTGILDGGLENNTAKELAKKGYVSAIVAYRDLPAIDFKDGGVSWNNDSQLLATDMSTVANAIIAANPGLSRDRVLTGGVSFTSFMLLTNIQLDGTPLADTRGVLAACGSSDGAAQDMKIPIFNLNCNTNDDGNFHGQDLLNRITDAKVKADSGFFQDDSCNSHCGGDVNTWTSKLVERTQLWLP